MASVGDVEVPLQVTITDNAGTVLDVFKVWGLVDRRVPEHLEAAQASALVRAEIEARFETEGR